MSSTQSMKELMLRHDDYMLAVSVLSTIF